jgi:hypothetical protein
MEKAYNYEKVFGKKYYKEISPNFFKRSILERQAVALKYEEIILSQNEFNAPCPKNFLPGEINPLARMNQELIIILSNKIKGDDNV